MNLTPDIETNADAAPAALVTQARAQPLAVGAKATKHSEIDADSQTINPELILKEPSKSDRSQPFKVFSVTLPPALSNMAYAINDFGSQTRFKALQVLPGFVLNHSSNVIGATQLVGEALYFKSSGVGKFIKDDQRGTWKAFVYPPINVVEGVFKKSAFHVDTKQLLNPKYMGNEIRRFVNLKEAARIDFARDGKLSNRWSARSGFAGMTSMAIAAAFPDEKDDPEVTEKMALMLASTPLSYAGHKIAKGILFPFTATVGMVKSIFEPGVDHHIGDGKREFSGIGMTTTGLFSVLAGFRQPRGLNGIMKYELNPWQMLGGAITTYAGSQLLMSIDNQQGWTNYGKTQFGRLLVLPMSIKERFPNKDGWGDPNAKFYFGAQGVFQFKNVVASLIGGAQKLPDGRIVDQKKLRAEAKEKAQEFKMQQRGAKLGSTAALENGADTDLRDSPTTTVSGIAGVERAMPERLEVATTHR